MICLNQAIETTDTANYLNMASMASIYVLRHMIFGNFGEFEESMKDALKVLSISEQNNLIEYKAIALLYIGKIHYMMYNDEKAEEFMLQAKTVAEENHLQKELMQITSSLGELYNVSGRGDEALPLLIQTLDIATQLSDTLYIIQNLRTLGNYHINLNRYKIPNEIVKEHQQTAKKYLDEALNLALMNNLHQHILDTQMALMRWCRVERNYKEALAYAQEVINNADPNEHTRLIQIYDHLVAIYAHLGDTEKSIESHQTFYTMMLKQSDDKLHRSLQEMSVKYETAKKELEIERQQAEINQHKTRLFIVMGGLFAAGILVVLLIYNVALRNRRNRELLDMNAIKDKFFSIISHDLKNHAVTQRDALQLLADNAAQWDTDRLSNYHRKLLKSANGLVDLIKNLLNWSQIQTGRKTFHPQPVNLVNALQSDIDVITNMAMHKNITFETLTLKTAIVTGDEHMLSTVVRNLLANAVKFTAKGGTVTLDISLGGDAHGKDAARGRDGARPVSTYVISVSDTGTGMSGEQINSLFRLNQQQSRRGTAGEQGSGLGLIVCKELLEKHGSTLHVESEEGKGSRFWFELRGEN